MTQEIENIERPAPDQAPPMIDPMPVAAPPPPVGKLSAARAAVTMFLRVELGAREVRITKIAPIDHGADGWFAEAETLMPNLGVKMLGLPLTQEILEREYYSLELESDLTVRSYEHLGQDDE
jgi:hypothetical protein